MLVSYPDLQRPSIIKHFQAFLYSYTVGSGYEITSKGVTKGGVGPVKT